jgi:hypothetical protein
MQQPVPVARSNAVVETEFRAESLQIAQTLERHAETRGVTLAQLPQPGCWPTAAVSAGDSRPRA